MEPVTLIVGALAAGAAAAAKETASQAVKDTYGGLKNLIQKWFSEKKMPQADWCFLNTKVIRLHGKNLLQNH